MNKRCKITPITLSASAPGLWRAGGTLEEKNKFSLSNPFILGGSCTNPVFPVAGAEPIQLSHEVKGFLIRVNGIM